MTELASTIIVTAAAFAMQTGSASVLPGPVNTPGSATITGATGPSRDDACLKEYEEWINSLIHRRDVAARKCNSRMYMPSDPERRDVLLDDLLREIREIDAKIAELREKVDRIKNGKEERND